MPFVVAFVNFILYAAASATAGVIAFVAWPRRHDPVLRWFIALCFVAMWITALNSLQSFVAGDLPSYVTLVKLEYLGNVALPVVWLGLALAFTEPKRLLTNCQIALLLVVPAIAVAFVFTNERHGLIWQQPMFTFFGDLPVFTPVYGPAFWLVIAYSYSLLAIGSWRILRSVQMRWKVYRVQAALLLIGTLLPWARSILLIFDELNPLPGVAFDAVFIGVGLVAYAIALLRLGLFSFMPFAYRAVFDLMPLGGILLDRDNHILAVNREALLFIGDDRYQLEGCPIVEIFPEQADWLRQLPSEQPLVDQLHIRSQMIEVNTVPIHNERGYLIGTLIQARDITSAVHREAERQRAEQTARVIQEMLQALTTTLDPDEIMQRLLQHLPRLVDHDAANIMLYDPATRTARIRYTNGYSLEEDAWLRQQTFPLGAYTTLATVESTRKPVIVPEVATFQAWVELPTTHRIRGYACAPILVNNAVFGFINLDVFRVGALSPEIANRLELAAQQTSTALHNAQQYQQAQQQAQELQRRIYGLVILQKMARDISMTVDQRELAAIGFEAMLRLAQTRGGFIALQNGQQLKRYAFYGEYNLDELDCFIEAPHQLLRLVDTIEDVSVIAGKALHGVMKDGKLQIILPLRYNNTTTTRLMGVVVLEDVSAAPPTPDRLEMLTLLADRLAVALRNASLVEEVSNRATELEQLNHQLNELEQLKSEMLRVAAHDLKTPLNLILNYVELLPAFSQQPDQLQNIYNDIRRAGDRMSRIISDFLSLERISKLATQLTTQVFAVHILMDRLEVDFFMTAFRKDIALELLIDQPSLYGIGDPTLVYEALSNLVSNAIKYTPRGGRVVVRATKVEGALRITVSDNGPGIPEEEQANLFMPFYRTRAAQQSNEEGTGLGLHLAKALIERQRGRVFFTSTVGQGSTFGFDLPLPKSS